MYSLTCDKFEKYKKNQYAMNLVSRHIKSTVSQVSSSVYNVFHIFFTTHVVLKLLN